MTKMLAVTFIGKNDRGIPAEWPHSPAEFDDSEDIAPECDAIMSHEDFAKYKAGLWGKYAAWKAKTHGMSELRMRVKAQVSAYILSHYSAAQQVTLARYRRTEVFDWIDDVIAHYHKVSDSLGELTGEEMLAYELDLSHFDKTDPRVDLRDVI